MLNGKKIITVMPAYNAAKTLEQTYRDVPLDVVDEIVLVDDGSCGKGKILEVTGGELAPAIERPRKRRCIPRNQIKPVN